MPSRILSVIELAKLWRVSPGKVRSWIASGELKAFNTNDAGKRPKWRILEKDAETFQTNRSNVGKQRRIEPRVKPVWEAEGLEEFV